MDIGHARRRSQGIADSPLRDPVAAVARLGAVQAQDRLGSLWAIGLRTRDATQQVVQQALERGDIVRTWPMRGTLHALAAGDVRWMLGLLAPRALAGARGRLRQLGIDEATLARSAKAFEGALRDGRRLTRPELYATLVEAGIPADGQRAYHILWCCAHQGLICLAGMRGKQPTFALLDEWVPPTPALPRDEALARLARRYFTGHGPATVRDLAWWSGLSLTDARQALELAAPELAGEVIAGREYWSSASDLRTRPRAPAVLLPPFDEYLVGYRDREAVVPPAHARRVNAGGGLLSATILLDGRIVGTWKRTLARNGVAVRLDPFEALGREETGAVENAAGDYARFLGLPLEIGA